MPSSDLDRCGARRSETLERRESLLLVAERLRGTARTGDLEIILRRFPDEISMEASRLDDLARVRRGTVRPSIGPVDLLRCIGLSLDSPRCKLLSRNLPPRMDLSLDLEDLVPV